jgi:outer membrane murein-binding lipoprotein Lpp
MSKGNVEQVREEAARTRRELGDTVEALAHKVDVPTRVKEAAQEGAARAQAAITQAAEKTTGVVSEALPPARRPYALGALGAVVLAIVVLLWRKR